MGEYPRFLHSGNRERKVAGGDAGAAHDLLQARAGVLVEDGVTGATRDGADVPEPLLDEGEEVRELPRARRGVGEGG